MSNQNKNSEMGYHSSSGISVSVLSLSVVISLLLGLIGGFFIGESRVENRYEELIANGIYSVPSVGSDNQGNSANNQDNQQNSEKDVFSSYDYTDFSINSKETIQSYYKDNETRYYAMNIIGKEIPDFNWVDSQNVTHKISEIAESNDKFIVELLSTTCGYCNASAAEIDKYRENSGNIVVSLALDDGDLTNFNQAGEYAWHLENESDSAVNAILQNVPWIPTFLYVEDGVIKLVEFGGVKEADIEASWNVAFAD